MNPRPVAGTRSLRFFGTLRGLCNCGFRSSLPQNNIILGRHLAPHAYHRLKNASALVEEMSSRSLPRHGIGVRRKYVGCPGSNLVPLLRTQVAAEAVIQNLTPKSTLLSGPRGCDRLLPVLGAAAARESGEQLRHNVWCRGAANAVRRHDQQGHSRRRIQACRCGSSTPARSRFRPTPGPRTDRRPGCWPSDSLP